MRNPRVSIVLINWNCYQDTAECVAALRKSAYRNFEIVVVDNASTDGSAERIEKEIRGIILIKSRDNLGWAGGTNLGVRDALKRGADYVLLLNADAFVEPDAIEKMVAKAESSPDIGLVSAALYYYKSRRLQHCGAEIDWEHCKIKETLDINKTNSLSSDRLWIWFTAALVNRKVIDAVGFFEERYFCYCEDQEYSIRAQRAGFRIAVAQDAKVFHRCHEIDVGGFDKLPLYFYFYVTRNDLFFFRKYSPKKIRFYRNYLKKIITGVAYKQKEGMGDVVDAYLDGLYCGFKGIDGRWDKAKKMPRWIRKFIVSHPNFCLDMLNGDVMKILKSRFHVNTATGIN